jgi:spore cortex biosynthesis protein YabQ
VSLQVQFITMGMMIACGIGLGVLYDVYRVLMNTFHPPKWLTALFDLMYWIFATLFVFRTLFWSNQGEVRVFIFIGLIMGVWTYFVWFSPTIIRMVQWSIKVIKKLIQIGIRLFQLLVIKPILFLYRCVIIFIGFLITASMFLCKIVLQLIYPVWILFKWLTKPIWTRLHWPQFLRRWIRVLKAWWAKLF